MDTSTSQLNDRIKQILGRFETQPSPSGRIRQLLAKLETPQVKQRDPGWPVWYFNSRKCYELILRAIEKSCLDIFIRHQDPPDDYWGNEAPELGWVQVDRVWQMPRNNTHFQSDVIGWLELGGWSMWCGQPIVDFPDAFETPPEKLAAAMQQKRVSLFLQSFQDNAEWTVAVVG